MAKVIRVEDGENKLLQFLMSTELIDKNASLQNFANLPPKNVNSNKLYQGVRYDKPEISEEDWLNVSSATLNSLNEACSQYGYKQVTPEALS